MAKKIKSKKQVAKLNNNISLRMYFYTFMSMLILFSAVFYLVRFNFQSTNDAKKIIDGLSSSDTNFVIENDALDTDKLNAINFEELKTELNIKSDVAIYFENSKNNEIISIKGSNCFGSKNMELNGIPCKSRN